MMGLLHLSARHARYHLGRTLILIACIALTLYLPTASLRLMRGYEEDLRARATTTPLIAGAKGNRFDLTLSALYFRQSEIDCISMADVQAIRDDGTAVAIPLHLGFTARKYPIVGTVPEYYELRALEPTEGSLPLQLGDVLLGAEVAEQLELKSGDRITSDPIRSHVDLSQPPALRMRVCGILPPSGSPDDRATFVDLGTTWILEGLAHGHQEQDEVAENLVLGRSEEHIAFNPALVPYHEVTDENLASYHFHGAEDGLPVTAMIVVPENHKARTLLKNRWRRSETRQMLDPDEVVDDLLAFVFRIKSVVDGLSVLLAGSTAALTALVMLLSIRLRRGEIETLHRMGCSRYTVWKLVALELALIVLCAGMIAVLGVGVTDWTLAPLLRQL